MRAARRTCARLNATLQGIQLLTPVISSILHLHLAFVLGLSAAILIVHRLAVARLPGNMAAPQHHLPWATPPIPPLSTLTSP